MAAGGGVDVSTGVIAMTSWGFNLRHIPHSDWCRTPRHQKDRAYYFQMKLIHLTKIRPGFSICSLVSVRHSGIFLYRIG